MTILPTVQIAERLMLKTSYSGIDSLNHCLDQQWFAKWQQPIDYQYNSRGFRDLEWPSDLTDAVWCLGDSFTAGIGSPFSHTWPNVFGNKTARRVINISMDGASNEWLARKCCEIYTGVQPKTFVIMWSYIHRREDSDTSKSDSDRRIHQCNTSIDQDYENLNDCRQLVKMHCVDSTIIELIIPRWHPGLTQCNYNKIRDKTWPMLITDIEDQLRILDELERMHHQATGLILKRIAAEKKFSSINQIIQVPQLDRARDGHHFDIATASWVAEQLALKLKHSQ
jgi:hypothetical protein